MKAAVAAFNQEKALVGAFSVITTLRMDLFEALLRNSSRENEGNSELDQKCFSFFPLPHLEVKIETVAASY